MPRWIRHVSHDLRGFTTQSIVGASPLPHTPPHTPTAFARLRPRREGPSTATRASRHLSERAPHSPHTPIAPSHRCGGTRGGSDLRAGFQPSLLTYGQSSTLSPRSSRPYVCTSMSNIDDILSNWYFFTSCGGYRPHHAPCRTRKVHRMDYTPPAASRQRSPPYYT